MPRFDHLAVLRRPAETHWRSRSTLAAVGAFNLATLLGAVACLAVHARASDQEQILAPAGIVLLASSLAQIQILRAGWRHGRIATADNPLRQFGFWRWLFGGAFFLYLASLAVGPARYIACALLAALSLWYALLLLPLAASPRALANWRHWTQGQTRRRVDWCVTATILLLVCGEAALRAHKLALDSGWFNGATGMSGIVAFEKAPSNVESADELDLRFAPLNSGRFRVAIVADQATLDEAERNGYLSRVQRILPGLEIVPLCVAQPWSIASPGDVSRRLAAIRPDVALTLISVCENLAHEPAVVSWFDWRQLEVVRWVAGQSAAPARTVEQVAALRGGDDFESFLRAMAPQLAACRAPVDEAMRARWRRTFSALDDVVVSCRGQQVPLGLVLVPGQFQVNRTLCETLVRRTGHTVEQIDVDLPQRSLAGFAEHRKLPVLDLLPHLRLSPHPLYQPNATTWNERGNTAAAAAIGGWLESCYGGQLALAAQLSSAP